MTSTLHTNEKGMASANELREIRHSVAQRPDRSGLYVQHQDRRGGNQPAPADAG